MWMKRALELAEKGKGRTNPNPMVGCVIIKDEQVVGEGYHEFWGGPHAEANALREAGERAEGSTVYVTLEPCSLYGKTPPCADALVKAKVKKVIVAMLDPNPLVAGRGIQILKEAGIEVEVGVMEEEARALNKVFLKYITTKQPYVLMKVGMTLDGKIATYTKDSKWISCKDSLRVVHEIRNEVTGIMVGIGTILADNPLLTTRLEGQKSRSPIRIILDSKGQIPLNANVLQPNPYGKTILATTYKLPEEKRKQLIQLGVDIIQTPGEQVQFTELIMELGKKNIDYILIEGGSTVNWSALEAGVVDEVMFSIAPKIIGGKEAYTPIGGKGVSYLSQAIEIEELKVRSIGKDLLVYGRVKKEA